MKLSCWKGNKTCMGHFLERASAFQLATQRDTVSGFFIHFIGVCLHCVLRCSCEYSPVIRIASSASLSGLVSLGK